MLAENTLNVQDEIDFEVVNTYLQQSRIAVYSALLLVPFLAMSFYHIANTKKILMWVMAVFIVDAYTLYTSFQFNNKLPLYEISRFRNRQHFLHILAGFAWGSAFIFLLNPKNPQPDDFRVAAVVGVVIAFSASAMSASLRGLAGFVLAAGFLTMLHFLSNLEYFRWWFVGLLGLIGSCLFFGWMTNKYILGQIENRLLNATYVDELRALNEKIEATNQNFIKRNIELQSVQRQLQILAIYDELTELHNRRYILERIEEKVSEVKRHQFDCCLAMLDVDHFKGVNDGYGHSAGDEVLRTIAHILTSEVRQGDIVARYGGEEFLILLPMTELSSAEALVERLRVAIERQPFRFDGEAVNVTASFGITQYAVQDNADKVIERADKALYQAKVTGRNRTVTIPSPD